MFRERIFLLCLGLAVIGSGVVACGRQDPASSAQEPMVQETARAPRRTETVAGELTAAGVAATYRALFSDEQLTRITEQRTGGTQNAAQRAAEYEFKGARLLKYSGASLRGADRIELSFDLQGALLSARGESGAVAPDDISAIRTRAQTLRSHALARRASQTHAGH